MKRVVTGFLATFLVALFAQPGVALGAASDPSSMESGSGYASGAMVDDPGCYANAFDYTQGNSAFIDLGFEINIAGRTWDRVRAYYDGGVGLGGSEFGAFWQNNIFPDQLTGIYADTWLVGSEFIAPYGAGNYFQDALEEAIGHPGLHWGWIDYEGHNSLCVTWEQIPFGITTEWPPPTRFANHFQLLIVDRNDIGPGDSDIVFNYGSIVRGNAYNGEPPRKWEFAMIYGTLPSVPFDMTYWTKGVPPESVYRVEIPGASQPGAYLDTSATGLAIARTNSDQPGRHVFEFRDGFADEHPLIPGTPVPPEPDYPPGLGFGGGDVTDFPGWLGTWPGLSAVPWSERTYVALGDSYQSGEGGSHYFANTNVSTGNPLNLCHRSPLAYPSLLNVEDEFGGLRFEFWACSGSTADTLRETRSGLVNYGSPWSDPALAHWADASKTIEKTTALDRLDDDTAVVTVGIGGNDLKLPDTLGMCLGTSAVDLAGEATRAGLPISDLLALSCKDLFDTPLTDELTRSYNADLWVNLFRDIHDKAPDAQIYVTGYPHLFEEGGTLELGPWAVPCFAMRPSDQRWANGLIDKVNERIRQSVDHAAKSGMHIQYVDVSKVGLGNELCSPGSSTDWFVNGLVLDLSNKKKVYVESFHPNDNGQALYAEAFKTQVVDPPNGRIGSIRQSETLTQSLGPILASALSTIVQYRGSDVVTTLISPSGERFDRNTGQTNLVAETGANWDSLQVTDPEPGEWTVELYGAEIDSGGEPYRFQWYAEPLPNEQPVALATVEQHGATVTVDASASYDPDGSLVETAIDFGEGPVVLGSSATHTYASGGRVGVTMWVKDDRGAYDIEDVGGVLTIPGPATTTAATPGTTRGTTGGNVSTPSASATGSPATSPSAPTRPSPAASPTPKPTAQAGPPAPGTGGGGLPAGPWVLLGLLVAAGLATSARMLARRGGGSA